MTATEALLADLKLWACSPRVPLKAQLVMIEAIGRLSAPPEVAPNPLLSHECRSNMACRICGSLSIASAESPLVDKSGG